jgi:plasmid stabilization system protein ParE
MFLANSNLIYRKFKNILKYLLLVSIPKFYIYFYRNVTVRLQISRILSGIKNSENN